MGHNESGHHGCDATYKNLSDRFCWPNMFNSMAYFVKSCIECRKLLKPLLVVSSDVSWQTAMLRHFNVDTIHMPDGTSGFKYIIQVSATVLQLSRYGSKALDITVLVQVSLQEYKAEENRIVVSTGGKTRSKLSTTLLKYQLYILSGIPTLSPSTYQRHA